MEKFKMWLNADERKDQVPSKDVALLLNRLDTVDVSIKAFNAIPVTHSAIFHVMFTSRFIKQKPLCNPHII